MTVSIKSPTSTTGSIQLNGSDVLTIDSSGNLTAPNNLSVSGTVSSTGDINFDSGTLYVDATNNRVGIGTSSPATQLHVSGTNSVLNITRSTKNFYLNPNYANGGSYATFESDLALATVVNGSERMHIGNNGYTSLNGSTGSQGAVAPLTVWHNSAETFGTALELKHSQAGNSDPILIAFNKHTPSQKWSCGIDGGNTNTNFVWRSDGYSSGFGTVRATLTTSGAFSASSKSFKIDHPLPTKKDTHHLVHMSVESPRADLIYRGKVELVNGLASINIDNDSSMTEGTFILLCNNVQCFTSNETGWTNVKGVVENNILTITAQDSNCTDTISWMVVGERKDETIINGEMTDDNGKLIVEPEKEPQLEALEAK